LIFEATLEKERLAFERDREAQRERDKLTFEANLEKERLAFEREQIRVAEQKEMERRRMEEEHAYRQQQLDLLRQ
jgi:hypothetical protein